MYRCRFFSNVYRWNYIFQNDPNDMCLIIQCKNIHGDIDSTGCVDLCSNRPIINMKMFLYNNNNVCHELFLCDRYLFTSCIATWIADWLLYSQVCVGPLNAETKPSEWIGGSQSGGWALAPDPNLGLWARGRGPDPNPGLGARGRGRGRTWILD